MEVLEDSPCTGVCRIVDTTEGEPRCVRCYRTYEDLDQWITMSREARLQRMEQIRKDHGNKIKKKTSR